MRNERWDTDEHWDLNDSYTIVSECEQCGERRPVQLLSDPFVTEGISDAEDISEWWCRPCFNRRADDV